jgi:outer membrane protein OmpA-like peptidoglycan-associated protein
MSFNLVDAAKSLFTSELAGQASTFLGENENGISKAVSGMVPSLLMGLSERASTADGAQSIANLAQDQFQSGVLHNLGGFFDNNSGLLEKGAGLASQLFGQKSNSLVSQVGNFAGIKTSSSSALMSMALPLILGLIGRHTGNNSGTAISELLGAQQSSWMQSLPQGLQLGGLFGSTEVKAEKPHQHHHTTVHREEKKSGMSILFPIIMFALLGAGAWYLFGHKENEALHANAAHSETKTVTETITTTVKGTVDSLGNYIYDPGKLSSIELPNGLGKLEVGENTTEARLIRYLNDKTAVLDTVKGNWFEFTHVLFNSGSAVLHESSKKQLENLILICKAFPQAKFKIGGYTDTTGNRAGNLILSQKRAEAVYLTLNELGAVPGTFTGAQGYGPEYPIADNATAEGRAQNRRVAVNVKAK